MHKNFLKAFTWNTGSTFLYKISLNIHQILLFSAISKTTYGIQASLFALIYTLIACTNFGIEETLYFIFPSFTKNKFQAKQLLFILSFHTLFLAIISLCLSYRFGEFLHNTQIHCNKNIIFILSFIFFIEGIKKNLSTFLQLALLQKEAAFGQISMIYSYITIIWISFLWNKTITLTTIFLPMMICSAAELCYISYNVAHFYMRLPEEKTHPTIPFLVIMHECFYNWINQISKMLYSPNLMTLWFSYSIGFQESAVIKFYTNIITMIYTGLTKIIGISTGVTFSTIQQLPKYQTHLFFKTISYRYFQLLSIITSITYLCISYAYYNHWITYLMAWYILGFFIVNLAEHWSLIYEQFFISHGKAYFVAIINSIGLLSIFITWYNWNYIHHISTLNFILIFLSIKTLSSLIYHYTTSKIFYNA